MTASPRPPTRWRPARTLAALLAVTSLVAGGCGSDDDVTNVSYDDAYSTVTAADLQPGDPIPAPTKRVVLRVTGRIEHPNRGDALVFDFPTLERLGLVRYTATDHDGLGRDAEFQGVLLRTVLQVAGVADDGGDIETIALNDYRIDLPISDAFDFPVMLATRTDGRRMSVDDYGPVRIVYPNRSYTFPRAENGPLWTWQLEELQVL